MYLPLLLFLIKTVIEAREYICTDVSKLTTVQSDQKLTGNTFLSVEVSGIMHCAQECLNRKRCKSFNVMKDYGNCQLNLNTQSEIGTLVSDAEWYYSDIAHWNTAVSRDCDSHTCGYYQVCQSGSPQCRECSNATECGVCSKIREVTNDQFRSYGCYHSLPTTVLPHLIVNLRPNINWIDMTKTILDCATAAKSAGYAYFGIEFYGECYGGESAEANFARPVTITDCAENCRMGVGAEDIMFVYQWV